MLHPACRWVNHQSDLDEEHLDEVSAQQGPYLAEYVPLDVRPACVRIQSVHHRLRGVLRTDLPTCHDPQSAQHEQDARFDSTVQQVPMERELPAERRKSVTLASWQQVRGALRQVLQK